MAAPTVVAVGTAATPATTAVTPPFPAGIVAGDILIGIAESAGAETYPSAATNGFAHVPGSPVTQDSQTTLTVIWARYDGVMTAHSWGDSGNHNTGRYIAIRGCPATGNPWDAAPVVTVESVSDTSASWPSVTTTVADTLVLLAIATGTDTATAQVGAVTNGALGSITKRMDNWTTTGTGGGYGLVTGTKASAGAVGASTCTITTAATKAFMTLALKPEVPPAPAPWRPLFTRSFSGTNAITCAIGGPLLDVRRGARSYLAVIKRASDSADHGILCFRDDTTSLRSALQIGATSNQIGLQDDAGGTFLGSSMTLATADGWALVGVTKAAGTVLPVGYRYRYSDGNEQTGGTGTNVADVAETLSGGSIRLGASGGVNFNAWDGTTALVAAWTRQLSLDEIRTLRFNLRAWFNARPDGLWLCDQPLTGLPVLDLLGPGHQTALSGTTAVVDGPPGFDTSLPLTVPVRLPVLAPAPAAPPTRIPALTSQYGGYY